MSDFGFRMLGFPSTRRARPNRNPTSEIRPGVIAMFRNRLLPATAFLLLGAITHAQDTPLPHSSIAINLPPDSPVTLMSADMGESRASARGGAMVLDLHMALKLRNNSPHRIRSLTMIVSAQEVTPFGRGSWSRWLDVGAGEVFPLPID